MKKIYMKALGLAAMALTLQSCLFQNPEMTEDGEMGVDPTDVTVAADINLSLTIPSLDKDNKPFAQPATEGTSYKRRVIVEALAEGRKPVTKTMLLDIEEGADEINVPVNLRLTARDYTLAVWSDFVLIAENGEPDNDYFYNADLLPNVFMGTSYRGNNNYKDAAYAFENLELSQYGKSKNARVNVDLEMRRPVARLQLYATDTRAFLDRIASGQLKGESFAVRVSYPGYLCMGYNIEQQVPRHSLMYMTYENSFSTKKMTADEPFLLTFDYLFAVPEGVTAVPIDLQILDADKANVLASASFTANCRAGYCTTINYGFLNSTNDQGITFDPDYSGEGTVVVVPSKPE